MSRDLKLVEVVSGGRYILAMMVFSAAMVHMTASQVSSSKDFSSETIMLSWT